MLAPPTSTTPKVALAPEKVAITRATPSRTKGVVKGEVQKTRVGKHNVISLLINDVLFGFVFYSLLFLLIIIWL